MGILLSSVKYTSDGVPYHTLKDFKFKEQLGSGGYGTVLKMSELNRFALKKRQNCGREIIQCIGYIFSQGNPNIENGTHPHEHIVQLSGVIWDEKDKDDPTKKPIYTGYVMEYMQLGSLHKEIHDLSKSYDIALILLWVKQIGSGLHYLHGNGIIHRDVKPSKIDHIKLADFGLARNISSQQSCTTGPIGTNVYMAPEVITSKDYGVPADVYSFGITIWEFTQRKDPSKHLKTSTDSSGIVSTELIMDADETYGGLTDLVKRCWQREISDRPSIQEIINFEPKFDQTILVVGRGRGRHNNKMKRTIWNRGKSTWTVSQMEFPDLILPADVVYLDDELYLIDDDKSLFKLDKNMEWKQLADMNEGRGIINNSCLGWNGYIWVFGGRNWGNNLKSVERYDPKEDKWALMPDMKYGRFDAAAAVCNGKIYICGGIRENIGDDGYRFVGLKSVECFDPESGVWTELADTPTPRIWHSLVCYRNKLVVIGGYDGKQETTTVLELDPLEENGQWKELSPLLSPISVSVGVVLGREIFAIGWDDDKVQIFDGINWRVGPSFPLNDSRPPSSAVLVPQEFASLLSYDWIY